MKNNRKALAWLLMLVLVCSLTLTGCRPSPVLMQKIYTADATDIDQDLIQKQQDLSGEQDEEFHESQEVEEENPNDYENTAGQQQEDASGDSSSKDLNYNANADSKGEANTQNNPNPTAPHKQEESSTAETTPPETPEKTEETEKEEETLDIIEGEEESEEEEETPKDDVEDDEGDSGEDSGDSKPKKEVTDGDGEVQEIPEDVQRVTAVGYAAALVEMLGGSGRLLACDRAFAYNSLAGSLCSDLSTGEVSVWWEDGSEPIDDYSFDSLLAEKPEVCFEISGQDTFTGEQVDALKSAGISYMVLPKLTDSDKLVDAAYIIAECLEENHDSGKSAKSIARKYEDWVKSVKSDVSTSNRLYSVYITEWRDDIGYTFTSRHNFASLPVDQGGAGYGVAIAWSPKKSELVSDFMKAAGVTNESTANSSMNKTAGVYVAPMFHQFNAKFDNSNYTYYTKNVSSDLDWFLVHSYGNGTDPALLGSAKFPAIIVASQSIKSSIQMSWYWEYHGIFSLGDVTVRAGYVPEGTTELFNSSIVGEYDIYVNPYGLGDWAEGSVDSPLEAYFVANKITGTISDTTMKSAIKSFYQKFFDASLSEDQINQILEGQY